MYCIFVNTVAESPTNDINCCCIKEIWKYRDFTISWNTTLVNETVVTNCKGDGVKGEYTT